ncbi:hypothetical protein Pint_16665 [Pistacia integerrima]|uniref:Uncharacterized protein n=1 Tax=Pistacia integerrima TaxID=434235 RepID=A0ACC0ZDI9_9ROSI|nr:hypothetical protein Pint_16665 [Pistacia integerrima]
MMSFKNQMKQNQSQISRCMNPRVFEISKTKYCSDSRDFKGSEVGEFTLAGLDSCEKLRVVCWFWLRIKLIRIHFAKSCDIYLRVRSRPIIEDCNGVRFGPYCSKYEGIEEYLEAAALSEETGSWGNVDDFRWLRAVQSPNWSVMPEDERLGTVDLADLGRGNGAS